MVSGCHPAANVLMTRMRNTVLLKTVILELMQSICAMDEKMISKACKTIQISPKILTLFIEITPPHFLKPFVPHRSPPCYSILLFMLIGLTKLKFLWAGEAIARRGTFLQKKLFQFQLVIMLSLALFTQLTRKIA